MHGLVSVAWGVLLAHYSWVLIIAATTQAVDVVLQSGRPRGLRAWTLWTLAKWVLYGLWIWLGLVGGRLSGLGIVVGFFLGWVGAAVQFARRRTGPAMIEGQ
ncbi:MAG: hypothetical protein NZ742_05320 [Acidobacteria bacterium]|nr:hypothetical protein [Acidobacteriota bacterium]MDW7984275.1 hypothetical protein [Acidobacteriota bacterium]